MRRETPLAQMAARELGKSIRRRTGIHRLFERDGDTLNILTFRNGTTALRIKRLPDGQVAMLLADRYPGEPESQGDEECWEEYEGEPLLETPHHAVHHFMLQHQEWAEARVRELALRQHPGTRRMDRKFFRQHYPGESKQSAARAALEAALLRSVGLRPAPSHRPGKPGSALIRELGKLIDAVAAEEAPRTMNISQDSHHGCTVTQYNAMTLHGPALRELQREAPLAAMIWWNHLVQDPVQDGATAASMAMDVRRRMDMKPAEWRLLMEVGHLAFTNPEDHWYHLGELTPAASAVVQANVTAPCPALTAAILGDSLQSWRISRLENEAAWRHWVWAVRQVLLQHGEDCPNIGALERMQAEDPEWEPFTTPCGSHSETLFHVGHAIIWHVQNGERWRNSNWRNLTAQAARWVLRTDAESGNLPEQWRFPDLIGGEEQQGYPDLPAPMQEVLERDRRENRSHLSLSWESLVGEHHAGGLTIRPVTTSSGLHMLGREMRNCLPYYDQQCEEGEIRIFSMHLPDRTLAAAGEVMRMGQRGWAAGEIQTVEQLTSRRDAAGAIAVTAGLYRDAEAADQAVWPKG